MTTEQWKKDKWKRKVIGFVAKLLGKSVWIDEVCYGKKFVYEYDPPN